ncbi:hypothetical protein [Caulobacter sp. X]|uniref:hypothetical protein n=1 Tax=Caulobacter sp. X TaxID=2048901 RepID=UPI000C153DDA|nr:hypothetical protein [Caulobacter sp. X]PIB96481.1 hypothetical protein CSW60_18405 [Caulobacter sp. X]
MTASAIEIATRKYGPNIRHDEPLEFTVDELRQAIEAAVQGKPAGATHLVFRATGVVSFLRNMRDNLSKRGLTSSAAACASFAESLQAAVDDCLRGGDQ